jgi:hypothetical protein
LIANKLINVVDKRVVFCAELINLILPRGEIRARQTRQLPRAVDLKGRFFVSCCGKMLKKSYILNFIIYAKFNI